MMNILYEDREIAVVEKPANLPTESAHAEDTVLSLLEQELTGFSGKLYPVHRLDRGTRGILVIAKTQRAASRLCAELQDGTFQKEYYAVTQGVPEETCGEYRDLLFHDSAMNRSYVVKRVRKGVREAALAYQVLAFADGKALVKIRLYTGRTHQIRAQFASRGLPLFGDRRYGAKEGNGEPALLAHRITFLHPVSGEELTFSIEPEVGVFPWSLWEYSE